MRRMINRSFCLGLALALVLQVIPSGTARAQGPAALSDEQVKERLEFITVALRAGQPAAKRWWYGWIAGYSAGAVGMGIAAATYKEKVIYTAELLPVPEDHDFQQDMAVGSATFALGVVGLLIDPFTPARVSKKLGALPETTGAERAAKHKRAEELLRECAAREKRGRGLTTHLLNIGVNAAAGVITSAAFKRPWTDGLVTFGIGEAVSLLNIFSQPMRATHDLKAYQMKYVAGKGGVTPAQAERRWTLSAGPRSLTFRYKF
jgi:hypothetical protein